MTCRRYFPTLCFIFFFHFTIVCLCKNLKFLFTHFFLFIKSFYKIDINSIFEGIKRKNKSNKIFKRIKVSNDNIIKTR